MKCIFNWNQIWYKKRKATI